MKRTALKTSFVGVTIATVAALSSGLSACSNASQSAAPTSSGATNTSDKGMDHGSMNQGGMPKEGMMNHSMGMKVVRQSSVGLIE